MSELNKKTASPLAAWLFALVFVAIFMGVIGVIMLSLENPLAIFQL